MAAVTAGLMAVLVLGLGASGGSASTLKLVQSSGGALGPLARTASVSGSASAGDCVVNSLPSFVDQGEFGNASSIADVVEVECDPVYAEHTIRFSSDELYSRCQHHLSWSLPYPYDPQSGSSFPVTLDNDGNATAVIWGGPGCAAGESLISAHMEQAPYLTVTAPFVVKPPKPTAPGVYALPKEEVENEETSSVATVIEVEFPAVYAEADVNINAAQLYARCHIPPKLVWTGPGGEKLAGGSELDGVKLDNDGNAFVVVLAGGSCASGVSEIEASLESAPYTTVTTTFTILPPQPTAPITPGYTIEKLQRLQGESTFTTSELTGHTGQTVEYEIVVKNTGNTALEFTNFQDAKCEGISGGPEGKAVQPGQWTVYTCTHTLTGPGTWTNAATVEGNESTGKKESNEVVVRVPPIPPTPEFTIEKLQRIDEVGMFTKNELTGAIGQTVDYEIVVHNTGTVAIKLSNFNDEDCEGLGGGASELAPGASTTFTCHHVLTTVGTWTNVASVAGGGVEKKSNEVVVKVPIKPEPAYTIEKLQRIESGSFTKEPLTGQIGQTVDYEIVVNNVGDVTLTFKNFIDTECEGIAGGPGPSGEIKSGQSAVWTCFHVLTSTGTWPNVAKIEGNQGTGAKESNKVVVNVPPEPKLAIEKRQMLSGEAAFTTNELTGTLGQVVNYEIIVTNIGNVPVTLTGFTDTQCVGLGGGAGELPPGDFTIYTCMHVITSVTPYVNVAAVEGVPPAGQGSPVRVESNQVVVKALAPVGKIEPEAAKCAVAPGILVLKNASGPKRHKFTVEVRTKGLKQVTFFLEGRKLKTFTVSTSSRPKFFRVTINTAKLRKGPHHISAVGVLESPACAPVKAAAVFVKPAPGARRPNFTG
jgi:uncharacterized repeat protein (TIGR01451 family)